jgi:hypothetical protein
VRTVFIIVALVLAGLWLLGFVTRMLGRVIHLLLVLAAVAVVIALVTR